MAISQRHPTRAVRLPNAIWHPCLLIFLQALWLAIFIYTGRSTVTGGTLSFHLHLERI